MIKILKYHRLILQLGNVQKNPYNSEYNVHYSFLAQMKTNSDKYNTNQFTCRRYNQRVASELRVG